MTAPNLTPAEALEFLKAIDAQQNVWDVMDRIKGSLGVGTLRQRIARVGIAGIEAALAKLAAYEAKLEPSDAHLGWKVKEPAAAVPSDEEIRKAIYMAKNMPQPAWTVSAIELVCQRIGVKL